LTINERGLRPLTIKQGEDIFPNQNDNEFKKEDDQTTEQNGPIENQQETGRQEEGNEEQVQTDKELNLQKNKAEQAETKENELLNKLLEDKQREIEEYRNRWLRAQADFDNYRKRMQREIKDISLYAGEQLVKDLLPVIDNFERALKSVENTDDAFYKGVKLIYQQIVDILKKHNITEIEAVGKPFDPNYHEAVMTVESEELESDTVAEVLLKGYMYHSKVIRPSMVKVVKN